MNKKNKTFGYFWAKKISVLFLKFKKSFKSKVFDDRCIGRNGSKDQVEIYNKYIWNKKQPLQDDYIPCRFIIS